MTEKGSLTASAIHQGDVTMTTRSKRRAKATKIQLVPMGDPISVPLNQLVLSPSNVRNIYNAEGIAALADSIARRGLLQSLSIRPADGDMPEGTYEVIAGGRRFRALEALIASGRIAEDMPVPCVLKTGGDATDDSLAENNDREALHPLDEFRAFKAMRDSGRADEDIAAAYRVTATVVRQRLRLANASPVLLQAYQDDAIDLETLMAYCVVDDHARQDRVFASVHDTGNDYPAHIKRSLTEQTVPAHDKRAKFVGLDAYQAAGGAVLRDLFDDEGAGYLQDPQLLASLVEAKLAMLREAELADGWGWVEAALEPDYTVRRGMDRISPLAVTRTAEQDDRLLEIDARLDALRDMDERSEAEDEELSRLEAEQDALLDEPELYAAADKARAGVFISIDWNGAPSFSRGHVRANDRADDRDGDIELIRGADCDAGASKAKKVPDRLVQDLTVYRTAALREAMAHDYGIAHLAVLHAMCLAHFYRAGATSSALQISLTDSYAGASVLEAFAPAASFDKRRSALRGFLPAEAPDLWPALLAMDDSTRKQLFAHCAGAALNAVREYPHHQRSSQIAHSHQLQEALGLHMVSTGWTPTVSSYLGRISKGQVLAAVTEACGPDAAAIIAPLKKDAMAKEAERLLQGSGWLPETLRVSASATSADAHTGVAVSEADDDVVAMSA